MLLNKYYHCLLSGSSARGDKKEREMITYQSNQFKINQKRNVYVMVRRILCLASFSHTANKINPHHHQIHSILTSTTPPDMLTNFTSTIGHLQQLHRLLGKQQIITD